MLRAEADDKLSITLLKCIMLVYFARYDNVSRLCYLSRLRLVNWSQIHLLTFNIIIGLCRSHSA